jgi:acetyl esterase
MLEEARPRTSTLRRRTMDPELAALHVLTPNIEIADYVTARERERHLVAEMRSGVPPVEVDVTDTRCARPDGSVIPVRLYRPRGSAGRILPVLLFIHGGSFVTGGLHSEDSRSEQYAARTGCAVIGLDYRLAPEHPFPAGLDDCWTVLEWLVVESARLEIDPTRIAVGGLSAGGGLAAGLAARSRDAGGPPIVLQLLMFPVLDARGDSGSVRRFRDTPVLTGGGVETMWELYLGPDRSAPPQYSSPAQLADLSDLPAAFISAAEYDPLRDEALDYASRLLGAGVSVDLRLYAHAYHSFDGFEAARLSQAARQDQVAALRAAFM